MAAEPPTAIKIFYCYAHEDRALRDELEKHLSPLKRMGQITEWHDRDIQAGTNWAQEIKTHLNTASIILLLVSPDFMSSDYCWSVEMTRALERHKTGEARVIPIILRRCAWEETPIGELQALPPEGKPISQWTDKDEAFWNVSKGIRATVSLLLTQMQKAEEERIRKVAEEEEIRKAREYQAQKVEEALPSLTKLGTSLRSQVGERWGNYHLIRLIGHGSRGDVFLGKHINLGTQAAIKVLNTRQTSNDIEQFHIEARVIASLVHPNIVQILDFGSKNLTPFLVMEYAPNGTFRERHPRGTQLSLPTIISYVKQIATALQYAHDRNVVHQDVKPDNMLVGRNNEVLLNDFHIFQGTEILETIEYMAPEILFMGQPCPASDQYSLGVVVYEWLIGNPPFDRSSIFLRYPTGDHYLLPPLPLLREKVPTLSTAVYQVAQTALDTDPMRRFDSVQSFATALEVASRDVV